MWQYQIIENQRHLRQQSTVFSWETRKGGEVFQTSGRGHGRGAHLCSGPGAVLGIPINPPNSPAPFKDKEAEAQRG